MKLGATCPIHKQNGIVLNGNHPHHLEAKKFRAHRGKVKVMLEVLLDRQGIVHYGFIPEGKTVSKEMYTDILSRLRDAVRRKCPHKGETTVDFSFKTMLQHTDRFWSRFS
jgi:hypothetical protein